MWENANHYEESNLAYDWQKIKKRNMKIYYAVYSLV